MIPGAMAHRRGQRADLLRFAAGARTADGFGYLDAVGRVDGSRPTELYITGRMTHVFSLGVLAAEPPAPGGPGPDGLRALATHGIRTLLEGPLHDRAHGGWMTAAQDGEPADRRKRSYDHSFVTLAAASALSAGIDGADELLALSLQTQEEHFWDEQHGMVLEEWDAAWQTLDTYRGLNAAMHTVESYLAAAAATGERRWLERALRIGERVCQLGAEHDWRLPEHFDTDWRPLLEHNRDRPSDPFHPYGATVGHGLEWARLLATLHTTTLTAPGDDDRAGDDNLLEAALQLADRAVSDGWAADGHEGFVYTTDWEGQPVVRTRMHWVLAEAIATSTTLHWLTGEARHAVDAQRWWAYADRHLISADGSWQHELSPENLPASTTWPGRPDVYHAYQAALVADTLGAASFAQGLQGRQPLTDPAISPPTK